MDTEKSSPLLPQSRPWLEINNEIHFLPPIPPRSGIPLWSTLIFCSGCGNVWARMFNPANPSWMAHRRTCIRCPSRVPYAGWLPPPGSILDIYSELDSVLPDAIWRQELNLEISTVLREIECPTTQPV